MAATALAAAASSPAAVGGARLSSSATPRASPLLLLPSQPSRRTTIASPLSSRRFADLRRFSSIQVRASSSSEEASGSDELLSDLKQKWDSLEDKTTVLLYGGGSLVALWLSSIVVGAINSVPLLPKILELVGLGYTGWFVYRYLLFKESRKELANDIEDLKKKIAGTE